jgi:uroporphyrinogen-III synthase
MRIFVFRPRADAERTARAVRSHGYDPIIAPLFSVVRLPEPAPEGPFQALVLTSGNAVPALADVPPAWRDLPVFTVGARTAARVREAGLADARSADGDRKDLINLIERNLPKPARLLLIVGRDRHEDIPGKLTEAGYEVVNWVAYEAQAVVALPAEADAALRQSKPDAALHYSARGARTFLALTQAAGLSAQALDLTHVAMSADVAAPLIAAGASTVLVAEYPEEAALLAALDQVARNGASGDATESAVAPLGVGTDKDPMSEPEISATSRGRARRTSPTIVLKAQDVTPQDSAASTQAETAQAAAEPTPEAAISPEAALSPEAVLPTEALPEEFTPPSAAAAEKVEPASAKPRLPLPALALAGLVGGVVGAGLVMLASSRATPPMTVEQIAELRGRIDTLQAGAAALDRKAGAASEAAAKAAADAQGALARASELAGAQAPEAGAVAGLGEQAQRAEAAATELGQRLDQALARIGSVETLAKAAGAPSAQAMAAARIVLAERIQGAIASGKPFAGDITALTKGGGAAEQIAALNVVATSGAPTRDALLEQFRGHRTLFAREVTPASGDWQDRLLGLASRIVTIRPIGDTGANDPATLPIRLENAIAGGNIVAAAALWGQLPEPARRASADFGSNLQKRAAADAAIAKIAQDAVAALGAAG